MSRMIQVPWAWQISEVIRTFANEFTDGSMSMNVFSGFLVLVDFEWGSKSAETLKKMTEEKNGRMVLVGDYVAADLYYYMQAVRS